MSAMITLEAAALWELEATRMRDARKIRSLSLSVLIVSLLLVLAIAVIIAGSILHAAEIAEVESQRDQIRVEMKATSERLEEALRVLNAVRSP